MVWIITWAVFGSILAEFSVSVFFRSLPVRTADVAWRDAAPAKPRTAPEPCRKKAAAAAQGPESAAAGSVELKLLRDRWNSRRACETD
jgi:hypothetical protein